MAPPAVSIKSPLKTLLFTSATTISGVPLVTDSTLMLTDVPVRKV